jgi:hypothetical protein
MLNKQGQKQFAHRLHAKSTGKGYIYYVLGHDSENPEYAPMSPNMTEDQVRARAASGEWPGMSDIEEVLLKARETAHKQIAQN